MPPDPDESPEARSVLDVRLPEREDLLVSFTPDDQPADGDLVVTVGQDRTGRRVRVPVGELLELTWLVGHTPRSRTAELLSVQLGADPTWRLAFRGPSGTVSGAEPSGHRWGCRSSWPTGTGCCTGPRWTSVSTGCAAGGR